MRRNRRTTGRARSTGRPRARSRNTPRPGRSSRPGTGRGGRPAAAGSSPAGSRAGVDRPVPRWSSIRTRNSGRARSSHRGWSARASDAAPRCRAALEEDEKRPVPTLRVRDLAGEDRDLLAVAVGVVQRHRELVLGQDEAGGAHRDGAQVGHAPIMAARGSSPPGHRPRTIGPGRAQAIVASSRSSLAYPCTTPVSIPERPN